MNYIIIVSLDVKELVEQVNLKIKFGYEPLGSPISLNGEWYQAMKKQQKIRMRG